jgi:hypothetical protein
VPRCLGGRRSVLPEVPRYSVTEVLLPFGPALRLSGASPFLALAQDVEDLLLGGKSPLLLLGEDLLVAMDDVEYATCAADQLWLDAEFIADCSRQTGGSGKVVSNDAVFDDDVHVSAPRFQGPSDALFAR